MLETLITHLQNIKTYWPEDSGHSLICSLSANGNRKQVAWETTPKGSAHELFTLNAWMSAWEAFAVDLCDWLTPYTCSAGPQIRAQSGKNGKLFMGWRENQTIPKTGYWHEEALETLEQSLKTINSLLETSDRVWDIRHNNEPSLTVQNPNTISAFRLGQHLIAPLNPPPNQEYSLGHEWRIKEILPILPHHVDPIGYKNDDLRLLPKACQIANRALSEIWFDESPITRDLPAITIPVMFDAVHPLAEKTAFLDWPEVDNKNMPASGQAVMTEAACHLMAFSAFLHNLPGLARSGIGLEFTLVFLELDVEVVVIAKSPRDEMQIWCGPLDAFIKEWNAITDILTQLDEPEHLYIFSQGTTRITLSGASAGQAALAYKTLFQRKVLSNTLGRVPKLLELLPNLSSQKEPA